MNIFYKTCTPILYLFLCISASYADSISSLFDGSQPLIEFKPAKQTFIFWINGDAERFRPSLGINGDIIRIDKQDIEDVRKTALTCKCNVVLFFDQRGSDFWYTPRSSLGAYLEVYSLGVKLKFPRLNQFINKTTKHFKSSAKKQSNKSVSEINQASDKFLSSLLNFSERTFPNSNLHLIYRGHSFSEEYNPEADESMVQPFDYSHVETGYSLDKFVYSLENANLKEKLASITFASCTMSYIRLMLKLIPFTNQVISSQIPILETGSTGFDLSFLKKINSDMDNSLITNIIANHLFNRFKHTTETTDILREAILTITDLNKIMPIQNELNDLIDSLTLSKIELNNFVISVRPSEQYILEKIKNKVSAGTIDALRSNVTFEKIKDSYDLIKILEHLHYIEVLNTLKSAIIKINYSSFTGKEGINIKL